MVNGLLLRPGRPNLSGWLLLGWLTLMGMGGSLAARAQVLEPDQDRIKVKVGGLIQSHEFGWAAYRFPAFKTGIIHYTNGALAQGQLNYHQLLGEMHFISPKGDTLALDNLYGVKMVVVDSTRFFYDLKNQGFGEELVSYDKVKLFIKHKFKATDKEKGVAYDQYSNTSATTNYGTYVVNGQVQRLNPNEYFVYAKKASYYLTDQNNLFYPANKASFLKVFSKNKTAVEKFIKENRIDWQKESDLKKLLSHCAGLTAGN